MVSHRRPDLGGELAQVRADRGRRGSEQVADQAADGGPGSDLLGCELVGGAQGVVGLLVLAPLGERLGGIDAERCLALGDGQQVEVHLASVADRGSGVSEADRDVDPVE